jgi:predicted DNA-binding mobile mystery protein A
MNANQLGLARKNLDKRFASLRREGFAMPAGGWLKAIREALGMTSRQLAERMGAAPSRVPTIEKAELSGSTTIKTLRAAAEAMDCVLVYAIVPRTSLEEIVTRRAEEKVGERLSRLNHTMALENQAMASDDLVQERARLVQELLAKSPRRIWDDA